MSVIRQRHPFRFKQFSVDDSNCSLKVGTDAVLLGAWADVENATSILDIGTGSGVVALMLAQRTSSNTTIDAIEIEAADYQQAKYNFLQSPWSLRVMAYHSPLQAFGAAQQYDLIVTNPPFFINSFPAPSLKRTTARHTHLLTHHELLAATALLLKPTGKFCLILPTFEGDGFQRLAVEFGLYLNCKTAFYSRKEKPQERWLMEFSFTLQPLMQDSIILYDEGDTWSRSYQSLTNEFYLDR